MVCETLIQTASVSNCCFLYGAANEIETAIENLCIEDKAFENVLEEEYKRIETTNPSPPAIRTGYYYYE